MVVPAEVLKIRELLTGLRVTGYTLQVTGCRVVWLSLLSGCHGCGLKTLTFIVSGCRLSGCRCCELQVVVVTGCFTTEFALNSQRFKNGFAFKTILLICENLRNPCLRLAGVVSISLLSAYHQRFEFLMQNQRNDEDSCIQNQSNPGKRIIRHTNHREDSVKKQKNADNQYAECNRREFFYRF